MALKLADVFVAITGDDSPLRRTLAGTRNFLTGWVRNIGQGIGQGIGQAIFNTITGAVRSGISEMGKATKAASDLNESLARTNAVFGENAKAIEAWSKTTSRALGVSQEAALSATGSLGNMFLQLGFSGNEAVTFSQSLVEASADIVAFHNVSEGVPSVLNDIASAFRGEFDPIQKFVPLINAATVAQRALRDTGKESTDQLTQGEKAAASYAIIMEGMGQAVGANARELDSAASQQRIFNAQIEEARALFGQVGLSIQKVFFARMNELLEDMGFYGENIVEQLVRGMISAIKYIAPALGKIRAVFVALLRPSSPPALLPELNEWGKGAAQEYMKGWTLADGSILSGLGRTIEGALRSFAGAGKVKETDLVARVFGSEKAITSAINEWRQAGIVSVGAIDAIRRSAGPAGDAVAGLVEHYFGLQTAIQETTEAQRQMDAVTRRYDEALSPLQRSLDEITDKQQEIRDNERLAALGETLSDPLASVSDIQLARLEAQEIQLRRQIGTIEDERDAAVDAEALKIQAAEERQRLAQTEYDRQVAILQQQQQTNSLIEEEIALRQRLADEAQRALEQEQAERERRQRELEAQQEQEARELERVADAQLRYNLATSDTAGQLEIWRQKLADAEQGSVDYYDALTQVYLLTKQLDEEMAQGGGIAATLAAVGEGVAKQADYLTELEKVVDDAIGTILGEDAEQYTVSPFWQNVIDTMREIGRVIKEDVFPFIQDMIAVITGDEERELSPFWQNVKEKVEAIGIAVGVVMTAIGELITYVTTGSVPEGDGLFSKIFSSIQTALVNLALVRDGEWAVVWDKYRLVAEGKLKQELTEGDQAGVFIWDQMIEIGDLVKAYAEGDWATFWDLFFEPPREVIDNIIAKIQELFNLEERLENFMKRFGFETNPFPEGGWFNPTPPPAQDVLPDSPFASFPSIEPDLPGLAALVAGAPTNSSVTGDTIYIEQNIATNGDFGGARQGALDGIREALLSRQLNGRLA